MTDFLSLIKIALSPVYDLELVNKGKKSRKDIKYNFLIIFSICLKMWGKNQEDIFSFFLNFSKVSARESLRKDLLVVHFRPSDTKNKPHKKNSSDKTFLAIRFTQKKKIFHVKTVLLKIFTWMTVGKIGKRSWHMKNFFFPEMKQKFSWFILVFFFSKKICSVSHIAQKSFI